MATLNKETAVSLGLAAAAVSIAWAAALWVATLAIGAQFEPRFLKLEIKVDQAANAVKEMAGEVLPRRDFELWIERSRNGGALLADPPKER